MPCDSARAYTRPQPPANPLGCQIGFLIFRHGRRVAASLRLRPAVRGRGQNTQRLAGGLCARAGAGARFPLARTTRARCPPIPNNAAKSSPLTGAVGGSKEGVTRQYTFTDGGERKQDGCEGGSGGECRVPRAEQPQHQTAQDMKRHPSTPTTQQISVPASLQIQLDSPAADCPNRSPARCPN